MTKEEFIDSKMKLSKEDIIYDYYKCEEKLIEKIGIEHENYELKQENQQLKECYCNRTDCSGRIKNSRNYDSLYQKYNKQLDNWNKLKEYIDIKLYNVEYLQKLCGCKIDDETHMILDIIKKEMQELEGSDSNE